MAAHVFETPSEKALSGALALVMHALFFAMLVFSVTWQKHEPAAMVAELWNSLPSPKPEEGLARLVAAGYIIEATAFARRHFNVSLERATAMVDALKTSVAGRDEP